MVLFNFRIDERQLESFNQMCLLTGTNKSHKLRAMINQELNVFWQKQKEVELLRQKLFERKAKEKSDRIDREISKENGWVEIGVQHLIM